MCVNVCTADFEHGKLAKTCELFASILENRWKKRHLDMPSHVPKMLKRSLFFVLSSTKKDSFFACNQLINNQLAKCGETEIRTRDTLLEYTRFPGVPLKPLEHLSKAIPIKNGTAKLRTFSGFAKKIAYLCRLPLEQVVFMAL